MSDINFGNTGVFGQYESTQDNLDYIPDSSAIIQDIVSGKIQSFDDLFEKIEYSPDPVVWNLSK